MFATLTALPLKPRLLAADAHKLIANSILTHFTVIPLDLQNYSDALQITISHNLSSGATYDALHLIGARAMNCNTLLTLNLRHFRELAPGDPLVSGP